MRIRLPEDVLASFRKAGARGGTIAGKRMTAAERQARASKGGHAKAAKAQQKKQRRAD